MNNGPSDNPGPITVVDNLPRVTSSYRPAVTGGVAPPRAERSPASTALVWSVGQEAGFSIRVSVVNGAAPAVVNPAEVTSPIEDTDPSNNKATDRVRVKREKQTADKLPPDPSVLPARKTEQGQKIRTKVRCRTLKSSAAGEVELLQDHPQEERDGEGQGRRQPPGQGDRHPAREGHEELQGLQAGEDLHRAAVAF